MLIFGGVLLMVQTSGVVVYLPVFFQRFRVYIPGGCRGFLNHQQYHDSTPQKTYSSKFAPENRQFTPKGNWY